MRVRILSSSLLFLCFMFGSTHLGAAPISHRFESAAGPYVAERVLEGLSVPSAIEFLPDGRALVAQRNLGMLSLVNFAAGKRTDQGNVTVPLEGVDLRRTPCRFHPV